MWCRVHRLVVGVSVKCLNPGSLFMLSALSSLQSRANTDFYWTHFTVEKLKSDTSLSSGFFLLWKTDLFCFLLVLHYPPALYCNVEILRVWSVTQVWLPADTRILPMHFNSNGADLSINPQMANFSRNPQSTLIWCDRTLESKSPEQHLFE